MKDNITSTTRERFPNQRARCPSYRQTSTPVSSIPRLYASEGFLNAVVDPAQITFNSSQTSASVLMYVHEGTQYHFGQISFSGDLVFTPNTELLNELKPFTSKPYTPAQVTNMQRAVVYYYKTHGYYDPKVDVQSDPKMAVASKVPVSFTVESGAVYRFGGVSQEGLERLSPKFLPDRFAKLKGKFYNPQALDDEFRKMMRPASSASCASSRGRFRTTPSNCT